MSDMSLYDRVRLGLIATLLAPLLVMITSTGDGETTASDRVASYISQTTLKKVVADKTVKTDDATKSDDRTDSEASASGMASPKPAGTYVVKEGDTYGCIAERYYGSYDQWTNVYDLNAGWDGFGEYHLAVGATLQMPAVTSDYLRQKTDLCQ